MATVAQLVRLGIWRGQGGVTPPAHSTVVLPGTGVTPLALSALADVPSGNGVQVGDTSSLPFELQYAPLYVPELTSPTLIGPGASWNGTAGSGYGGSFPVPTDPTRTTAKPALRPIEVPGQRFASDLVFGFAASAKGGVQKVTIHCEGTTTDITSETLRIWTDANGVTRSLMGYWFTLDVSAFLALSASGNTANIYAEAVANDGTMQHRVMGPYPVYPEATEYEETVHFGAGLTKDLGASPKTFPGLEGSDGALTWARGGKQNVRLVCQTSGTYNMSTTSGTAGSRGFITIEAAPGVTCTIGKTSYSTDSAALMRPGIDRLRFRGERVVIDYAYMTTIYAESTSNWHWFDGCMMINSLGPRQLWRKGTRPTDQYVRWAGGFYHYFTEVKVSNLAAVLRNVALARKCEADDMDGDFITQSLCVVGTTASNLNNLLWRTEFPALSVSYSGSATTATIRKTGGNDLSGSLILAEDGVDVVTISLSPSEGAANYNVSDIKALIEARAGWAAAVADADLWDLRRASALSKSGTAGWGSFTATNAKGATVNLVTAFDVHGDFYQCAGAVTNVILREIAAVGLRQMFAIFFDGACTDFCMTDCAFHAFTNDLCQLYNGAASHLIIENVSLPDQNLSMLSGFAPDTYCSIRQNVFQSLVWGGTPDADITIDQNHLIAGTNPSGGTNTTMGGSADALFPNRSTGDFNPASTLLSDTVAPLRAYDLYGATRSSAACRGAKQPALSGRTISAASAAQLVARTLGNDIATGLGPVQLRWRVGSGESGALTGVDVRFDIAA